MGKQFIISISREYGSGGHQIAEEIAKELEVPLLDRDYFCEQLKAQNADGSAWEEYDERPKRLYVSRRVRGITSSIEDILAEREFDMMRERAASGDSFVVVGRCSEYVLKDNPNLITFFVNADLPARTTRIINRMDVVEQEAKKKITKYDKSRAAYHNAHTGWKWGDATHYDVCINSARLGTEGTKQVMLNYIKQRIEHN